MPFDALCLSAVVAELLPLLVGGRVEKIYQPDRCELHIAVRTPQHKTQRLLIGVAGGHARLHLTARAKENPAAPPMFCMLLRKHLTGAKILSLTQERAERVAHLDFSGYDELGSPTRKRLTAELTGRCANLFLLDGEGRILSSIRRVDDDISSERALLPGLFYRPPTLGGRQNPLSATADDWAAFWADATGDAADWLLRGMAGFAPLLAREAVYRATGSVSVDVCPLSRPLLAHACHVFFQELARGAFCPVLILEKGRPKDVSCVEIRQYEGLWDLETQSGFSVLLDRFYTAKDSAEQFRRKVQPLIKTAKTHRDRAVRKLAARQKEYTEALDREALRIRGELLMAHLHMVEKGSGAVTVDDYYTGGRTAIALDPAKSPQQNAAKYFKDYAKAKRAEQMLAEQQAQAQTERHYWESVLEAIDRCTTESELLEIREEISPGKDRKKKPTPPRPHLFLSASGLRIWAGRNNAQNDLLTLRTAGRNDWWLHVQKIPGAHVVIESPDRRPDDKTFWQAAVVAATLSQAKNGVKVPVDFTQVKNVKKPPKAKPGMVTYDKFKTILADPDPSELEKMRREP